MNGKTPVGAGELSAPSRACSVYFAESIVNSSLRRAWEILLCYEVWNPGFATAETQLISGRYREEGELVLIAGRSESGELLPAFYAETVRIVPYRHIVWYVYPQDGNTYRNFLDFSLTELSSGVRFDIQCYAREQMPPPLLSKHRVESEDGLRALATAFKSYCEAHP